MAGICTSLGPKPATPGEHFASTGTNVGKSPPDDELKPPSSRHRPVLGNRVAKSRCLRSEWRSWWFWRGGERKKKEVFRKGREKKTKNTASLKARLFQEPANKGGNVEGALPQSGETWLQTSGKSPRLELKEKSGELEGWWEQLYSFVRPHLSIAPARQCKKCEHMYADFHRHRSLWVKARRKPVIFCSVVYRVGKKNANKEWKWNLWNPFTVIRLRGYDGKRAFRLKL